ncbi:hypothetical protein OESDEN_03572 [Oesophagostomum dentatum]|uniref:Uncharacterized protein n=1 Tax=Oesophagostomum dentatum TaxID=61180 RepID=A0A0B1TFX6_OESDE|nr:hypothetical protein OESDEN_03572 [Oesophagostomum dentatum]
MALHFHKTPIIMSATTLKNLTTRYKEYTSKVDYPTIDEDSYEKCQSSISLLQSGVRQIREGRENLQKLYAEIRDEYKNCKNKSERKDLMAEIEQIEEESQLQIAIGESNDLIFMLTARLDEAKSVRDRMEVKLGYIQKSQRSENTANNDDNAQVCLDDDCEQTSASNESENVTQALNSVSIERETTNHGSYRSIKPPQATLPKFYGNAEDFPEYWAIFDTLVHKSKELDVMEKILLLKESLKGRAQTAIKGIKLIPQNYEWIIRTLQQNYCNQPTNRSQIVQKLVNLKSASDSADSCLVVYDHIHMLINQMVSAGYDVRSTNDPMWSETILAKFPRDIVKPVLVSGQMQDRQTIEDLMANLKKEIAAKGYVENRLGHAISTRVTTTKEKSTFPRPSANEHCLFYHRANHTSWSCRTVNDQCSRQKILRDENRCWKCGSINQL